jgi:DNA-binding CsgD family transcriptional regulator
MSLRRRSAQGGKAGADGRMTAGTNHSNVTLKKLSKVAERIGTNDRILGPDSIRSNALEAALNALATGVFLTDRHGCIVFMNRLAEREVKNRNVLRVDNNRLTAVDRFARAALAKAIYAADQTGILPSGSMLALPQRGDTGLIAAILPLVEAPCRKLDRASGATVAIFVQNPAVVGTFPSEAFANLYGLTGSELRVLLAMAPGLSVKEAAGLLDIRDTTAKTHLQRIYTKTGTSKQSELIRLFMSSTPPITTTAHLKGVVPTPKLELRRL